MIPLFPLMIFGGGFLLATTKTPKKKATNFELIETGSMSRLPKEGEPDITIDLRRGQMIEIMAAGSPSITWVSSIEGESVKVDRKTRMQGQVSQMTTFSIKAIGLGDSKVLFKMLGPKGPPIETRHIRIAVMG